MDQDELDEVLEQHVKWLNDEGGERANLRGANLRDAHLRHANLMDADLRHVNLMGANLRDANLRDADLRDVNLRDADLRHVNLMGANLRDANLMGANLMGAKLRGADLPDDFPYYKHSILPDGELIVWKGCDDHVLKLRIPQDAQRVNGIGSRKCRASEAEVLAAYDTDRSEVERDEFSSNHAEDFTYVVGETAIPDDFDDDPRVECSNGIHFHITFQEAKEWA